MIKLENISRVYSKNKQSSNDVVALDNINLNFDEKGFISILGASGSGKTTLLNIIGGLDTPTSGNMIVDGLSTSEFKNKDWDSYRNEKIGFVLQNCYLLPHLTVKDNVALKLQISNHKYDNIDELVDNALKEVDLLDKKNEKPKALSGGQKQRVAIARAIIGKPTVILADEPTGALDSKTGKQIMDLLKKLSENHLVVIVTHNKEYAEEYSDRIIELQDGKVISDNKPLESTEKEEGKQLERVSFPLSTSIKWGFKNLIVKKYSTLSIILASSLGLAGVGLILSMSSAVTAAFIRAEAEALSEYPVTISSYSRQSSEGSYVHYDEYPTEEVVYVDLSNYAKQEHYNYMSEEFLTYMGEMPKDYYYVDYSSSYTSFRIFTQVNETTYRSISSTSSLFYKGIDDVKFLNNEYDCLKGNFPTQVNEVALVVDTYNRVNGSYLYTLGFDVDISEYHESQLTFNDIIGKTYRYVPNNDFYYYDSVNDKYNQVAKSSKQFYEEATVELKITGILREKKDSDNPLFRTGVIYTPAFGKMVVENANNSEIVIAQKQYGLSKNVSTGLPYEDTQSGSMKYSKEYLYEEKLFNLGAYERVTTLYYFTKNYASREKINTYFENYVPDEMVDFNTLSYSDYLERATSQFDGAIKLMTSVLYVFAGISVFVSAILNAILTYISIHQRTNEIGLLRSLGARKKDIAMMVETESVISGFLGGLLSIGLSVILVPPLNTLLIKAIYQYNFYLLSKTTFTLGGFQFWVAPILVGLAIVTALVSALIPAIIASRKDPAHAINE